MRSLSPNTLIWKSLIPAQLHDCCCAYLPGLYASQANGDTLSVGQREGCVFAVILTLISLGPPSHHHGQVVCCTIMSTPDRGWIILAISWPLFAFSAILVVLRVWVRTRIIKSWGWDDPFIILALLCATINTALATMAFYYGTGRHAIDLSPYQQIQSTKYNWLSQGFHVMSTNWGKVSVALFMLRISHRAKHHRPAMWTGIAVLSIINVVCVYTIYGQCTPTSRLWASDMDGSCWDPNIQKNYAFFQGCMCTAIFCYLLSS